MACAEKRRTRSGRGPFLRRVNDSAGVPRAQAPVSQQGGQRVSTLVAPLEGATVNLSGLTRCRELLDGGTAERVRPLHAAACAIGVFCSFS